MVAACHLKKSFATMTVISPSRLICILAEGARKIGKGTKAPPDSFNHVSCVR